MSHQLSWNDRQPCFYSARTVRRNVRELYAMLCVLPKYMAITGPRCHNLGRCVHYFEGISFMIVNSRDVNFPCVSQDHDCVTSYNSSVCSSVHDQSTFTAFVYTYKIPNACRIFCYGGATIFYRRHLHMCGLVWYPAEYSSFLIMWEGL